MWRKLHFCFLRISSGQNYTLNLMNATRKRENRQTSENALLSPSFHLKMSLSCNSRVSKSILSKNTLITLNITNFKCKKLPALQRTTSIGRVLTKILLSAIKNNNCLKFRGFTPDNAHKNNFYLSEIRLEKPNFYEKCALALKLSTYNSNH